jgi:sugar-specific transcriptional regulator TrmB
MADELEILEELGLSANEAKIYLTLVKGGAMKANELSVKSKIPRSMVYDIIAQLEKKGMAGRAEVSGVTVFSPSPPSSLLSFLDEKRDAADKLLPLLSKPFEAGGKTNVSVTYGAQGLKMILEDIIALRADYCVFYGQFQIFDYLPKFFPIFNAKRVKLGIRARYLQLDLPNVRERAKKVPLSETKFIDPSSASLGVWWVYADRVVLFILQKEPTNILIKNADLARTFQHTFDEMFRSNTEIYRGAKGLCALLGQSLNEKELCFIGGSGQIGKRLFDYLQNDYAPKAAKTGVKWYNIAYREIQSTPMMKVKFHTVRFLPKNWQGSPNVIWIWGDTVANVVWLDEPVAFVVKNKDVANAYKRYFWLIWKNAKKK